MTSDQADQLIQLQQASMQYSNQEYQATLVTNAFLGVGYDILVAIAVLLTLYLVRLAFTSRAGGNI